MDGLTNKRIEALRQAVKQEAEERGRRRHLARMLSATVHIGEVLSGREYGR